MTSEPTCSTSSSTSVNNHNPNAQDSRQPRRSHNAISPLKHHHKTLSENQKDNSRSKERITINAIDRKKFRQNEKRWLVCSAEMHCTAASTSIGSIKLFVSVLVLVVVIGKLNSFNKSLLASLAVNMLIGGALLIGVHEKVWALFWPYLLIAPIHLLVLVGVLSFNLFQWAEQQPMDDQDTVKIIVIAVVVLLAIISLECWLYLIVYTAYKFVRALNKQMERGRTATITSSKSTVINGNVAQYSVPVSGMGDGPHRSANQHARPSYRLPNEHLPQQETFAAPASDYRFQRTFDDLRFEQVPNMRLNVQGVGCVEGS